MALIDLLAAEASEGCQARGRYDEERSLTLDALGVPLVVSPSNETREITEVSGERDDPPPREPAPSQEPPERDEQIRTFVERESDDLSDSARVLDAMRTDTSVERERPDRDAWW